MTDKQFKQLWIADDISLTETLTKVKLYGSVSTDIVLLANTLNQYISTMNELYSENKNLKNALWEAEEDLLYELYRDNPIRRDTKIEWLKKDWERCYWNDR